MGCSQRVGPPRSGAAILAVALALAACGDGTTSTTAPETPTVAQTSAAAGAAGVPADVVLGEAQAPAGMEMQLSLDGAAAIEALRALATLGDGNGVIEPAAVDAAAASLFVTPRADDDLLSGEEGERALVTGAVVLADPADFGSVLRSIEPFAGSLAASTETFDVDIGDESIGLIATGGSIAGDASVVVWRRGDLGLVVVAQGSGNRRLALDTAALVDERAGGGG